MMDGRLRRPVNAVCGGGWFGWFDCMELGAWSLELGAWRELLEVTAGSSAR